MATSDDTPKKVVPPAVSLTVVNPSSPDAPKTSTSKVSAMVGPGPDAAKTSVPTAATPGLKSRLVEDVRAPAPTDLVVPVTVPLPRTTRLPPLVSTDKPGWILPGEKVPSLV